jgi:NitT/TauT family transport system substrate-binding protein
MVAVIVLTWSVVNAADRKINVAYSSISGNMAPLWVAHERGFFRKYGLDTQVILTEGGGRAAQALISGNVAFAQLAGPAVIQGALRGADTVLIAGVVNTMTLQFFVDQAITEPNQLKGKSLGVTRSGSSTDFALRYALDRYGLKPDNDAAILELATMPRLFEALEGGQIHGAMLSAPFASKARKAGFRLLANLQMLGLEYQDTGIVTTRALIKSQPELVRNFMRAYVEAIHYYKTHRGESLAILQKYLNVSDSDALTEIYEDIGLALVPEKPYPSLKGIQTILQEFGAKDPVAAAAQANQFADIRFVQELDTSGFVTRLYKATPMAATRSEPRPSSPDKVQAKLVPEETATVTVVSSPLPDAKLPIGSRTVPAKASPSLPPGPKVTTAEEYTIKAGDTLSNLATKYYGSYSKWDKIYAVNKEVIKNPDYIFIGQKIKIPPADPQPGT